MLVVRGRPGPQLTRLPAAFWNPMLPRRHSIFLVLCLALRRPRCRRPRRPSPRQTVTFEAPRELLDDAARDAHARRDPRLRRHPRPPARLLARLRAAPERQDASRAGFDAVRPRRLPRGHVGNAGRADRGRRGAQGIKVHAHAHRPGAEVGDQDQEGQPHAAEPEGVPGVRDRHRRAATATSVEHVVDLERAQPAAVPEPQYRNGKPYSPELYRKLYQAGVRGPARDAGQRAGHDPDRRDVAARQLERRPPAGLPARDAVPGLEVPQDEEVRRARRRRLRAPRVHDERRARGSCPPTRDDVTIGVLSRLERALDKAGKARRAARAPADLPDRVRDPVARRTRSPACRSPTPGGLPRDRRAHRLREPARGARSRST